MITPLFVYGTLRDDQLRRQVLGRDVAVEAASARGVVAVFHPGRVYPALRENAGGVTEVLVLRELAPADLMRFDAYEGEEYFRRIVTVTAGGRPLVAQAYWARQAIGISSPAWSLVNWQRDHRQAALVEAQGMPSQALARS